jgi:hypothetical protein
MACRYASFASKEAPAGGGVGRSIGVPFDRVSMGVEVIPRAYILIDRQSRGYDHQEEEALDVPGGDGLVIIRPPPFDQIYSCESREYI